MALKDRNVVITISDGTTGEIVENVEKLEDYAKEEIFIKTNIKYFKMLKTIENILEEKEHDVFIRQGYKL